MSLAALTLTIDLTTKEVSTTGQIAIREDVTVKIYGANAVTTYDVIELGLLKGGTLLASLDTFTDETTYFQGTLSLSTEELVELFGNKSGRTTYNLELTLWDTNENRLLINDHLEVMNNPYDDEMTEPTAIDPIDI